MEVRPTAGQAELGEKSGVPKYNLGTRGTISRAGVPARQEHRLENLCYRMDQKVAGEDARPTTENRLLNGIYP